MGSIRAFDEYHNHRFSVEGGQIEWLSARCEQCQTGRRRYDYGSRRLDLGAAGAAAGFAQLRLMVRIIPWSSWSRM